MRGWHYYDRLLAFEQEGIVSLDKAVRPAAGGILSPGPDSSAVRSRAPDAAPFPRCPIVAFELPQYVRPSTGCRNDREAGVRLGGFGSSRGSLASLPLVARRRRLPRAGRQWCCLRTRSPCCGARPSSGGGVPRSGGEDAAVEFPAVAFEPRDQAVGGKPAEREGYGGATAGDQAADDLVGQR